MTDLEKIKDKVTTPLKVKKKTAETPSSFSFELEIPENLKSDYQYSAGQFITLFMNINDEWISRSYSLCTSPSFDEHFQITVKRVEGGRGSNWLADSVNEGDTLEVTKPQGTFFQPLPPDNNNFYFLFAAGSGITPVFSIAKEVLKTDASAQVYLFYCNRTEIDVIYKDQLEQMSTDYKGRFHLTYMFSKPETSRLTLVGRCSALMAKNFVIENSENAGPRQAYMCGPEGFMNEVEKGMKDAGLDDDNIRKESFGTPVPPPETSDNNGNDELNLDDKVVIGDDTPLSAPKTIQAIINGETVEVAADKDTPILESLIEAGQNPPYSCMNGACMACMAKVTKGRVYQEDPGILTDENVEAGETLTCQAKPLTETVIIDYDDF